MKHLSVRYMEAFRTSPDSLYNICGLREVRTLGRSTATDGQITRFARRPAPPSSGRGGMAAADRAGGSVAAAAQLLRVDDIATSKRVEKRDSVSVHSDRSTRCLTAANGENTTVRV